VLLSTPPGIGLAGQHRDALCTPNRDVEAIFTEKETDAAGKILGTPRVCLPKTEYPDPRRDEWTTKVLPALKKISLARLVKECEGFLSRRALIDIRAGRSTPYRKNQDLLASIAGRLGLLGP
jgi:hypothetical protein